MDKFMGLARRQKYELTIYALALTFILGLFRILDNELLAGTIKFIFGASVLGNVGSKVAGVFEKKEK